MSGASAAILIRIWSGHKGNVLNTLADFQTVIGTIVGALIVFLTGWCTLSRTWKREDETRHHEKRQQAYLKFLQSARLLPYAVPYSHVDDPQRQITEEVYGKSLELMKDLRDSFGEIEMFASPEVLEAATKLTKKAEFAALFGLTSRIEVDEEGMTTVREEEEIDEDLYRMSLRDIEKLRKEFIKVVRKELGVDRLK